MDLSWWADICPPAGLLRFHQILAWIDGRGLAGNAQMNVLIKYSQRLGDICRCLPIARHFAALGERVFFACKPCYHGIFEAVTYCTPVPDRINDWPNYLTKFDLEIWPDRYEDFRRSGQSWSDFVYGLNPALTNVDRRLAFDAVDQAPDPHVYYNLPHGYCVLAPFGYSQMQRVSLSRIVALATERMPVDGVYMLVDAAQANALVAAGWAGLRLLTAQSPGHLPRILRDAAQVMTINSAPTIIAAAVRDSYFHIVDRTPQDDFYSDRQVRLELE